MKSGVDFVVAGAQKAGTTALAHFLRQHPQIGLCRLGIREPHYFSRRYRDHPEGDYTGYHALFTPEALSARVTGDITPIYIYLDGCLERIRAYNPEMKVIVILRNPVLHARSQWAMNLERNPEFGSFLAALPSETPHYLRHGQHVDRSLLQRGLYGWQLRRLFELFPRRNCLVLKHEDLRTDHAGTLARVHDFLGVDSRPAPPQTIMHARSYAPKPRWQHRALVALYRRDIRRVERLLGWDCSDWLRVP